MSRFPSSGVVLSLVLVLTAYSIAARAAVDTSSGAGASAGSSGRVPCSSLPELRHLALKVAILGDCNPNSANAPPTSRLPSGSGTVQLQSLDGSAQAEAPQEGWIFTWKGSASAGEARQLNSVACGAGGRFNATCTHRYAAALPGFAARFQGRSQLAQFLTEYADQLETAAPDGLVSLRRLPLQAGDATGASAPAPKMLPSYVHTASLDEFSAAYRWGLDRIDQPALPLDGQYKYWNTGDGVHVYILDTGIRASHLEFRWHHGRAGSRASEVFVAPSLDPSYANLDCEGHGTHVAGVVGGLSFGVAKDARLHAMRVLDCNGNGAVSDVLLALDWLKVNAQRPAIVGMSLGGEVQLQLDEAVRSVAAEGIHVVVAAGNEDMDACDTSPAREASAVTVGATNDGDQRLWLAKGKGSNYGECVDLFAPGTSILSAAGIADDAQQLRTGTSQAVPFVAGVMALILQNNTAASPEDMRRLLAASAARGHVTEVTGNGYGSLEATATPNLLVQASVAAPFAVSPSSIGPIDSPSAGPYAITVALSQQPTAAVEVQLSVDPTRGAMQPASLSFSSSNWMSPQTATLTVSPFGSADSTPVVVELNSASSDSLFRTSQTVLSIADLKGNSLNYPKTITALPFAELGSTSSSGGAAARYVNQYDVVCGQADADTGGAPDVAYYFKPARDCTVTASLCGSAALPSTFDSRLYLLADVDAGGELQAAACSNDACGVLPSLTASLKAGVGYAFVVDGVNGAYGPYSISITAREGGVAGEAPPASLLQASVSVASIGPAAATGTTGSGSTPAASAASGHYWLLGPWSPCSTACTQTRTVTCYNSSGARLPASDCAAVAPPASQQTCTDCAVTANSSDSGVAAPAGSDSGSSSSMIIIVAGAAGAALAVLAAVTTFLCVRRKRRARQAGDSAGRPPQQREHAAGGKGGTGQDGELDCIPLPKHLRPIATGRDGRRAASPRMQHLVATAGPAAAAYQQQQQQQGRQGGATAAHGQGYAPEYHVVHLPSPRFPGQDTGSPSGVRRSLRQRSPTRRPRDGARATPDLAQPGEHRLARSGSSGHANEA